MLAHTMSVLATFVHVSDLHLGDMDPQSSNARCNATPPPWWPQLRLFDGYLGHSGNALRHLHDYFHDLRRQENAQLIVTGDLTCVGSPTQFALATDYLSSTTTLPSGAPIGLRDTHVMAERSIPGNHDHWPGVTATTKAPFVWWGGPTSGLSKTFPSLPIHRLPLGGGRTLVMAGLDSDAEVQPNFPSLARFAARGHFRSELVRLGARLGPPKASEIRVLLMHHSPMHLKLCLGVDSATLQALHDLIERHEISVILTGHVHVPAGDVRQYTNNSGVRWDVLEARCGTTTQRDELPLGWNGKALPPNTLVVHRVRERSDKSIEWTARVVTRTVRGFGKEKPLRIKGRPQGSAVRVWPRT